MYSPQAKTPTSLLHSKKRRRDKKNLKSTKTFLRKRLGEERFGEIMEAIAQKKVILFDDLRDILTPAERDLGIYMYTVLINDTPRTDSSFRESSKGTSRFGEQSRQQAESPDN